MKSLKHSRLFAIVLVVLFASGWRRGGHTTSKGAACNQSSVQAGDNLSRGFVFCGRARRSAYFNAIPADKQGGGGFPGRTNAGRIGQLIAGTPIVKSSGNTATMEITLLQNREFPDKTTLTSGDVISARYGTHSYSRWLNGLDHTYNRADDHRLPRNRACRSRSWQGTLPMHEFPALRPSCPPSYHSRLQRLATRECSALAKEKISPFEEAVKGCPGPNCMVNGKPASTDQTCTPTP